MNRIINSARRSYIYGRLDQWPAKSGGSAALGPHGSPRQTRSTAAGATDQLATVMQEPWLALRARRLGQRTKPSKVHLQHGACNRLNITPWCLCALRNKVVIGPQITVTGTASLSVGQLLLMVLSMHQLGQIMARVNVSCWQ